MTTTEKENAEITKLKRQIKILKKCSEEKEDELKKTKAELGEFLNITSRTVFRCLNEAEEKGLLERHEPGLRASEKWIKAVEVYDIKANL